MCVRDKGLWRLHLNYSTDGVFKCFLSQFCLWQSVWRTPVSLGSNWLTEILLRASEAAPPPPRRARCVQQENVPHSSDNFVKHAKPLKSPARDPGSCATPEPGRCKGREDLCDSGLVLPRAHAHKKRENKKKKCEVWINNICFRD